jgi:SM-20-related protein
MAVRSDIPLVILDEFLVLEEWRGLLRYALANERGFSNAEVIDSDGTSHPDQGYRRSRVIFNLASYAGLFQQRLMTFLPYVLFRLRVPAFPVSQLEIQLTATNHGEFFRVHADSNAKEVQGRQVTFVYYFHGEPRQFGGGELRVYGAGTQTENLASASSHLVHPRQNQAVFFPSSHLHEILPVVCPSRRFADSRFTVNGWYRT